MAKHLPELRVLNMEMNALGWEGIFAVATNLIPLESLSVSYNKLVGIWVLALGRLPSLKILTAGIEECTQIRSKYLTGRQ